MYKSWHLRQNMSLWRNSNRLVVPQENMYLGYMVQVNYPMLGNYTLRGISFVSRPLRANNSLGRLLYIQKHLDSQSIFPGGSRYIRHPR